MVKLDFTRHVLLVCAAVAILLLSLSGSALAEPTTLIEAGTVTHYLANSSDPEIGMSWTLPGFNDGSWLVDQFGVGFEAATGAEALISTTVPETSRSIYTRTTFNIPDVDAVDNLFLGADYDDGIVIWLNGFEIFRSAEMNGQPLTWDATPPEHESSNGSVPDYTPLRNISDIVLPILEDGDNLLAIGLWNADSTPDDLVLVPQLIINMDLIRGPYLQLATPDSVIIRWRTELPSDSRVYYGTAPGSLTNSVGDLNLVTEHLMQLSGLSPSTRYYYAIGSSTEILAGDDADHYFETHPPPGPAEPTRLWVLGDSGFGSPEAISVRDAYHQFRAGQHTDLWLHLGDVSQSAGLDDQYQFEFFDIYTQTMRTSALWPAYGNHDGFNSDANTQTGPYFDNFTMPTGGEAGGLASGTEAYYSFDYANIHFVVLDSFETSRSPNGDMLTWLELDLADTDKDWIIVYWHHPPYSKGSHDSDTEIQLIEMRAYALPILDDYGVDLVLSGHSHSYERSYMLDGHYGDSTTLVEGMKVDGGDGREDSDGAYTKTPRGPVPYSGPADGIVYCVAGSSGEISGGALDHPAHFISLNVLGSLVIDIDGDRLDAQFLDNTGTVQDYYTIVKDCPGGDTDLDLICDALDNCPGIANSDQVDSDGDDLGDLCDDCPLDPDNDIDGDDYCADQDNCPLDSNPSQQDFDSDGLGDACDPDDDGDGVDDTEDCAQLISGVADLPPEIPPTLQVDKYGGGTIYWERPFQGHASNIYRGQRIPDTPVLEPTCLEAGIAELSVRDATVPASGTVFLYLAVSRNSCGDGSAGLDGTGAERIISVPCPVVYADFDMDGVENPADNCPTLPNLNQLDQDFDFVGSLCDNCPADYNPDQLDTDGDLIGDACDPD